MAEITISVDNAQWANFQKYYLKRRSVPLIEDLENLGEYIPSMSVGNWIKQSIVNDIYQTLLEGKQMEAFNELDIDVVLS